MTRPQDVHVFRPNIAAPLLAMSAFACFGWAKEPAPATTVRSSFNAPDPFAPSLRYESGPVIDVVPGKTAVIIVDPAWKLRIPADPVARLDDGRILPTQHRRIVARASTVQPRWIDDPGEWSTTAPDAPLPPPSDRAFTAEAFAVELPLDALGQGIWIEGTRLGLNWLVTTQMIASLSRSEGLDWSPTLTSEQRGSEPLLAMLAPLSRSPLTRWRYRLLTDGLSPAPEQEQANVQFADSLLEALAQQHEACWRHGLAKIKQAGPRATELDASYLVTHTLTRLVAIPSQHASAWLPCWVEDTSTLSQLLSDLVAPQLASVSAAERARTYSDLVPKLIAVGIDDAAALHPATGAPMPVTLAMNLSPKSMTASARIIDLDGLGNSVGSELISIPPDQGQWITQIAPAPVTPFSIASSLLIETALHKVNVPIQTTAVAVHPPGLTLTPFFLEWKQADLIRESPRVRTQPGVTATLTYRSSVKGDALPDSPSGWVLLVERRANVFEQGAHPAESMTISWGSRQTESRVVIQRQPDPAATAPVSASQIRSVMDASGNWFVEMLLPNAVIEPNGVARLGVLWDDGQGKRASWPRASLPTEMSPGRALLNLSDW